MNAAAPPSPDLRGIHLADVCLARDDVRVLDKLSVNLSESRIGVIGHNGSGKSSLARVLNGLLPVASGEVSVFGEDPARGPEHMSHTVGFIFQNPDHQLILPTVIEELTFGLVNQGHSTRDAEKRAIELLDRYGHADWKERPVHSLSEGQKQLVCIFAVILMQPRVLVLDEPFSALDLPTRYRLLDLLHSLPQQIIMISHELDTLTDFDRIIWLEHGQVKDDGLPQDVLARYQRAAKTEAQSAVSNQMAGVLS